MKMKDPDPDPDKKITNTDEQEVVVNQSTVDHGFDEPGSSEKETAPEPASENTKKEERRESLKK